MEAVPTPEEFEEWRQHPVTRAVMDALEERREWLKESLIMSRGVDLHAIGWNRGKAEAIEDMVEMRYEEFAGGGD